MRYALAVFAVALTGCMVGVESDDSTDGSVVVQALTTTSYSTINTNGGIPLTSSPVNVRVARCLMQMVPGSWFCASNGGVAYCQAAGTNAQPTTQLMNCRPPQRGSTNIKCDIIGSNGSYRGYEVHNASGTYADYTFTVTGGFAGCNVGTHTLTVTQ